MKILIIALFISGHLSAQSQDTTQSFAAVKEFRTTQTPAAPVMQNPVIITSKAELEKHNIATPTNPNPVPAGESPLYPAGNIHYLGPQTGVTDTTDVIIDLRQESEVITDPIRIWQARNVHIIGLRMKLKAPAGGGANQLKNSNGSGFLHFANPYPRVPGGAALGITHSQVLYLEGCEIDCNGNNVDAIVPSPNFAQSNESQLAERKIILINSRITGFRGHNVVEGIGEGLHCDAIQLQSGTVGRIVIENVDVQTGHEGFVLNPVSDPSNPAYAPPPGALIINNVSYDIDTRFIDADPKMHQYPVALATSVLPENIHISNFHYRRLQGNNPKDGTPYDGPHAMLHASFDQEQQKYIVKYYVDPKHTGANLHPWPGLTLVEGTVAANDLSQNPMTQFAPEHLLGSNYKSGIKLY
jgi:hypothetical protein